MSQLDWEHNVCRARSIRVIGTGTAVFIIIIVDGGMRSRGGLRAGHITTVDPASIGPTFARHDGDMALARITVACAIRVAFDGRIALDHGAPSFRFKEALKGCAALGRVDGFDQDEARASATNER